MTMSKAAANESWHLLLQREEPSLPNICCEDGIPKTSERLPSMVTLLRDGAIIANAGSTARDHLANERTYLAWMRTGLALIGASLGLLKWDATSNTEGYLVAAMGIAVLVMATHRYFRVMQLLAAGKFEPNVHGILSVVSVVVAAIATAFALQHKHAVSGY